MWCLQNSFPCSISSGRLSLWSLNIHSNQERASQTLNFLWRHHLTSSDSTETNSLFFKTNTLLFILIFRTYFYFWLLWIFIVAWTFSSCGKQKLVSSCVYVGFSLQWLLLFWSMVSRAHRLQQLWWIGLFASLCVESSWTRNWTWVPCIGRQILKPWTTKEVKDTLSLIRDFNYI